MISTMNPDTVEQIVAAARRNLPRLKLLYVFGSFASGQANSESDLDLAFFSDEALSELDRFRIANKLSSELHKEVDLINLKTCTTVIRHQVVCTGTCIFVEGMSRLMFEAQTLSMYQHLQFERREILEEISQRYA